MNGPHDMGGMTCYGPVIADDREPVFHEAWEKKALALTVAMGFTGSWNIDISRHARESLPPEFYTTKSYYQIWLAGLEKLMLERGMVSADELISGKSNAHRVRLNRKVAAFEVPALLAAGSPVSRDASRIARFSVGDAVRTINFNPVGHTRLPRYARDKTGLVEHVHGCHVFPDTNASGEGENPTWLYSVSFKGEVLFGEDSEPNNLIMIDCWEPYLEPA